jgi:hypothetical protein
MSCYQVYNHLDATDKKNYGVPLEFEVKSGSTNHIHMFLPAQINLITKLD